MSLGGPAKCDWVGCGAERRDVNRWYVVLPDAVGVHVYEWHKAPEQAMKIAKHFCGLGHALQFVSKVLTPDETAPDRESTLDLKPPLTREGVAPEQVLVEQETEKKDNAE